MNQEVTDYIQAIQQPWQVEVCDRLRQVAYEAIPDVTERIQYGKPHFLKDGKYAAVLAPAKGWVSFMLFNAAGLQAPGRFFQPGGAPERKTIRIHEGQSVDYNLLATLLQQASAGL